MLDTDEKGIHERKDKPEKTCRLSVEKNGKVQKEHSRHTGGRKMAHNSKLENHTEIQRKWDKSNVRKQSNLELSKTSEKH